MGPRYCSAIKCSSNSKKHKDLLSFFKVPRDASRARRWIVNSRREDLLDKPVGYLFGNIKFCSLHFEDSQFMNEKRTSLVHNAVPTLFDVTNPPERLVSTRKNKEERAKIKLKKRGLEDLVPLSEDRHDLDVKGSGSQFLTRPKTYCSAAFCNNNDDTHQLFHFPKDPQRCLKWAAASNHPGLMRKEAADLSRACNLCSVHFEHRMFMNEERRRLVWNAVPTKFIWEEELQKKILQMDKAVKRQRRRYQMDDAELGEAEEWGQFMRNFRQFGVRHKRCTKYVYRFIRDIGMRPRKRLSAVVHLERVDQAQSPWQRAPAGPPDKKRRVAEEPEQETSAVLEEDVQVRGEELENQRMSSSPAKCQTWPSVRGAEYFLYDGSLLEALSFRHFDCFNPPVESPLSAGEGISIRPLSSRDVDKGYLLLLSQLTKVGNISRQDYIRRFDAMKRQSGTYFITVIEDTSTHRIIGAASLVLELKFIHSCSSRGHIEEVVVSDQYRGKQLGKIIVATKLEMARKLGCYKVSLNCTDPMIKFYSIMGFRAETGNANCLTIRLS